MCITAFSVVVGVIVSNVNNQANGDRYVPYWLHKICYALSGLCCVSMITWEERHCNVKKLRQVGLFVFFISHRLSMADFDLPPRCPQFVWCH